MSERGNFVERTSESHLPYDRTWARVEFLRALRRTAPQVVSDLRQQVVPACAELAPSQEVRRIYSADPKAYMDAVRLFFTDSNVEEAVLATLRPVIRSWGDDHGLTQPDEDLPYQTDEGVETVRLRGCTLLAWVEPVVLMSLIKWIVDESAPPDWVLLDTYSLGAHMEEPKSFSLRTEGWAFLRETKSGFTQRVRTLFEAKLKAHLDERERDNKFSVNGTVVPYPSVPERSTSEHFDWLVAYQVNRLSRQAISQQIVSRLRTKVKRQAVSKGINLAAQYVVGPLSGLWLRRRPGGAGTDGSG